MTQALDLTFDRTTDRRVRREWDLLADAGLPSLARHTAPSNRPHLTLDSREEVDPTAEEGLAEVADRLPVRVRVGGPLLFRTRGRWVLARHVVVDRVLLDLHEHAHRVLGAGGAPLTSPGSWVPHLTLARGLTEEQLPAALALVGPTEPFTGTVLRLRRWDQDAGRAWDVGRPPAEAPG